jgi:hypothetical protein
MAQVELKYMYINIGANNESKKLLKKTTVTSGKLLVAVYASYVYEYLGFVVPCIFKYPNKTPNQMQHSVVTFIA